MLEMGWKESEDIERYIEVAKVEKELSENHPEILKLWSDLKITKKLLGLALKSACDG